jgi:hypothetical protein
VAAEGAPMTPAPRQRYLKSTMLRDAARHRLRPRAVRLKLPEMFFRPTTKSLERLDQGASQLRKRIFYFRRHNWMHCALHQAVALEAAQGLSEHFLRNTADLALKRSVTHRAAGKNLDDERSPFVSNAVEHQPGGTARI